MDLKDLFVKKYLKGGACSLLPVRVFLGFVAVSKRSGGAHLGVITMSGHVGVSQHQPALLASGEVLA